MWDAYCTMYWFLTGDKIVRDSYHILADETYGWFLSIENGVESDSPYEQPLW